MKQIPCERCGDEHRLEDMQELAIAVGRDDYEIMYFCDFCYNRVMENAERIESEV